MFLNNFAWRNYIFPFCLVAKCCVISTFLLLELRQAADGGGVNDFYHYLIPIKRCREGGTSAVMPGLRRSIQAVLDE